MACARPRYAVTVKGEMALFNRKKKVDAKTAKELADQARAERRAEALKTGFVVHPEVEKEYKRQRFFIVYEKQVRAAIFLGFGLVVLVILGLIALVIIRNIPGRDDDNDGVLNINDVCPGFDDQADADDDGVPDGCEEIPPFTNIDVTEANIIATSADRYDVALKVINPNQDWGVSPLEYTIHLLAEDGSIINSSSRRESFLLPGQQKYLTAYNILALKKPARAELTISLATWLKVQNYEESQFDTTTVSFDLTKQPGAYATLKSKTTNRTTFTYDNIQVTVIIRNTSGQMIALNSSEINTLQPAESRDFIVTFPQELPQVQPSEITYETDVDVFRNDTFVQTQVVRGQRFQQFTPQPEP